MFCQRKKGQVLLETTMVLVCLALLAFGSSEWFFNLNQSLLSRFDLYRDTRRHAANNPASLAGRFVPIRPPEGKFAIDSTVFLDYFPQRSVYIPEDTTQGSCSSIFYQEDRLSEAAALLEEQSLIQDLVLPYKINQANYLAGQFSFVDNYDENGNYRGDWRPSGYVDIIKKVIYEAISNADRAYNDFSGAIVLYKDVLNEPMVPGPFDPNPQATAYGLNPEDENDLKQLENIKKQNETQRQNLQSMIDSLESVKPSLEAFLNMLKQGVAGSPYLGLGFARSYIGEVGPYGPSSRHNQALETLNYAVNFGGNDIPSSILSLDIADYVYDIYSLLESGKISLSYIDYNEAEYAKMISDYLLGYYSLPTDSGSSLNEEELEDTINKVKEEDEELTVEEVQQIMNEVQRSSVFKKVLESLNRNLGLALESWFDEESEAEKDACLTLSIVESWALNEVGETTFLMGYVYE